MSQFRLVCNFKKCRKILLQSAYVTTCSHVFCNEHGLNITTEQNLICPVCDNSFQTIQDIIRVNLNPDEVTKTIMLAGLSPDIIMEVATRALTFWGYQMNEENSYLETGLKTALENITVLGGYCENSHTKYTSEINALERKIDSLHEELEVNKKRSLILIQQLQEKEKFINKLQANSMRKNSATATVTGIKQDPEENYSPMMPTRFKPSPVGNFWHTKPEQSRKGPSANFNQNFRNFTSRDYGNKEFVLNSEISQSTTEPIQFNNFAHSEGNIPEMYPPMHPFNRNELPSSRNQDFHFQPNLNF